MLLSDSSILLAVDVDLLLLSKYQVSGYKNEGQPEMFLHLTLASLALLIETITGKEADLKQEGAKHWALRK